jgi:hypothetical protein
MGNLEWELTNNLCPMPYALCPMPYAPFPMPHSLFNQYQFDWEA